MPIKPENKDRYPLDWRHIRAAALSRARHRCEFCGILNHAWGYRDDAGKFWPVRKGPLKDAGYMKPPFQLATPKNGVLKIIEIVLTIAHLDHQPENCAPENLKALCQRCHLRYDHDHHQHNAYQTRRKGKAVAELF